MTQFLHDASILAKLDAEANDARSPLALWREPSLDYDALPLEQLSSMLWRLHVLHEPLWREALRDDLAAALGIGLRNLIPGADGRLGLLDVVMSAVLVHAARGNTLAASVLQLGRNCLRQ